MGDESPGAMIRRARQEAHMKQRELADRMGVHVTTVGYWERNKFFPEQHWAALNKLLRINIAPPGAEGAAGIAERGPDPAIPDDVLAVIRKYPPEKQREIIEMLVELSGPDEPPGQAEAQSGPDASGTRRAG